MYQEKMACAIKVDGKVLREVKDTVYLPFGSEYSFLIKNLHSRRAIVHIEIDGQPICYGGLVVRANSTVDVERFIKDNLREGNRFKFIERTSKVEEHRGIGVADGLVRIEFEYAAEDEPKIDWNKILIKSQTDHQKLYNDWISATKSSGNEPRGPMQKGVQGFYNDTIFYNGSTTYGTPVASGAAYDPNAMMQDYWFAQTASASSMVGTAELSASHSQNEAGITVEGSVSSQQFIDVASFKTDGIKHVMVLKLLGQNAENEHIRNPMTVKTKIECKYCGKVNKADQKFCGECGSAVKIV